MDDFKNAALGIEVPSRLIITSDWQDTLCGGRNLGFANYTLFEDLSDAHRAGHRVIITSTISDDAYADSFKMIVVMARRKGYDVLDPSEFEKISKLDLKKLNLEVDYAFDNESIEKQPLCRYVRPAVEIRIDQDGGRSPLNRTHFRALMCLPPKPEFGVCPQPSDREPA